MEILFMFAAQLILTQPVLAYSNIVVSIFHEKILDCFFAFFHFFRFFAKNYKMQEISQYTL